MRMAKEWASLGEALAFVGNSLLSPMNQTETVGLEPQFWEDFPGFDDAQVVRALEACRAYAEAAQAYAADGGDAVQRASVEFTKLFIGPPRPLAPPWETMHQGGNASVGFGEPTFAMQELLRKAGLQVSNENNQYADHIGIELLYASVLCARIAEADGAGDDEFRDAAIGQLEAFAQEHPLIWIDRLRVAVDDVEPSGYIASMLGLAKALLLACLD